MQNPADSSETIEGPEANKRCKWKLKKTTERCMDDMKVEKDIWKEAKRWSKSFLSHGRATVIPKEKRENDSWRVFYI